MPHPRLTAWRSACANFLQQLFGLDQRRAIDPQLRERYLAAVNALPPLDYTIFTLHRFDEVPIVDVAAALDMTTAEVEDRLASALVAIARAIDQR